MKFWKWFLVLMTPVYCYAIIWALMEPFATFQPFLNYSTDIQFHLFSFALLSYLVCFTLNSMPKFRITRNRQTGAALLAAVLSFGFGGFTEAIQKLTTYRTADWTDFQCDLTGAFFGIAAFILTFHIQRWRRRRERGLAFAQN